MKPYKLKHTPTGLYYQPKKHRGANLSERGKIYQTKNNILSMGFYSDGSHRQILTLYANKSTRVYKKTKDILPWKESYNYNECEVETKIEDWVKEEIL